MTDNPYQSPNEPGHSESEPKRGYFWWMLFGALVGMFLVSVPVSIWSAFNFVSRPNRVIAKVIAIIFGLVLGAIAARLLVDPENERPLDLGMWLAVGVLTFIAITLIAIP